MNKTIFLITLLLLTLLSTIPLLGEESQKKKIVFLKDDDGEFFKSAETLFWNIFDKKGYTKENSEHITLSLSGNVRNAAKIVKELKDIKPDLMLMNGAFGLKEITSGLKDTNIPILIGVNVDLEEDGKLLYIDKENNPTGNVTGMHSLTKDYESTMFKLMNFIVPIKDKKVVMIMPNFWKKEKFEEALSISNIPLKKI